MLNALLIINAVVIIVLVLLQHDKQGFMNSITGSTNIALFAETKERGMEKVLVRATGIAGTIFMILVVLSTTGIAG